MAKQLTPQAAKVLEAAQGEARQFNHDFVGTEHLLLALLADEASSAGQLLNTFGVDAAAVRSKIAELILPQPAAPLGQSAADPLPLTPRANTAIAYAADEVASAGEAVTDTDHLLLGLLHEHDGVAGRVLRSLALNLDALTAAVFRIRLAQMKIIEQVVRPMRASIIRKRKLREELLAHLSAIYEDERSHTTDSAAALKAAAERFGNPTSLAGEFSRDVPLYERIGYYFDRWLGWRAPESATRYMLRVAGQQLVTVVLTCLLLAFVIGKRVGWNTEALAAAAPIVGFLLLLPVDTFLLCLLYYKTRDALWGAFGARKSKSRVALLQCAFAGVILVSYLVMIATTRSLNAVDVQQWSFGLLGALISVPICLHVARTNGPIEIRDTIWACLDLETAA